MDKNIDKTIFDAILEEDYTEKELAKGILFLLKEYYIGSFKADGEKIRMHFENGQKFVLTVNEYKEG